MRSVFSRRLVAVLALILILAAPTAFADTNNVDPGLWAQFTAWLTTADQVSFDEWLVMMARIWIPGG